MRLILILTLLLTITVIASAQDATRGYRRVPLQGSSYPEELRSTACWINQRKDVVIVDGLPSSVKVEEGTLVLLPESDGDYLFLRDDRGWLQLARFRGKWEAPGILLEMGPCRIKTFE